MTTADSDKAFKQAEHRRERRVVKALLELDEEPLPPRHSATRGPVRKTASNGYRALP